MDSKKVDKKSLQSQWKPLRMTDFISGMVSLVLRDVIIKSLYMKHLTSLEWLPIKHIRIHVKISSKILRVVNLTGCAMVLSKVSFYFPTSYCQCKWFGWVLLCRQVGRSKKRHRKTFQCASQQVEHRVNFQSPMKERKHVRNNVT